MVRPQSVTFELADPVPLIAYQPPSMSREVAIRSLERAGRTWRITCNVREVNGILAAVRAGIGIAVFPQSLIPPDLARSRASFELPQLGDVDFALVDNPLGGAGAGRSARPGDHEPPGAVGRSDYRRMTCS